MHFSFLSTPGHRRLFPCLTDRLCIDCVLLLRDGPGRSGLFLFDGLRGSAFIASRLLFFRTGPRLIRASPTAWCKDIISSALWPYMGEMTAYLLCACSELWCHVLLAEGPDPSSGGFSLWRSRRLRCRLRSLLCTSTCLRCIGFFAFCATSGSQEAPSSSLFTGFVFGPALCVAHFAACFGS